MFVTIFFFEKKKVVQNDIPDNEVFEDFWRANEEQKESMSKNEIILHHPIYNIKFLKITS